MNRLIRHLIILLLILLAIILALIWAFQSSKVPQDSYEPQPDLFVQSRRIATTTPDILIVDNTVKSRKIAPTEPQTLASLTENRKYESLIDCLAYYESSNNPDAYNRWDPYTPSIGLLQFKRKTFNHYCVEKYGLPNNIWSAEVQRECANKMLKSDINLITHWSTSELCY